PLSGGIALTIVLPAYNEESRLPKALPELVEWVSRAGPMVEGPVEVIVVDDGSSDATSAVAAVGLASLPAWRVVALPRHAGKGAAVRRGLAEARGSSVVVTDADLSYEPTQIPRLLDALAQAAAAPGYRSWSGL